VELTLLPAVGTDNKTSALTISQLLKRQTRSDSRMASYIIPSILEQPTDDDSEPEGNLI
jgi:hypothetical protein